MEGSKKIIAAVILIIVIVAAVVFIAKKSGMLGGPQPPQWVLDQPIEKIDTGTLETQTLKLREWDSLGHDANGKYKSKTGKYTMTLVMTCEACKAKIPVPDLPRVDPGKPESEKAMQDAQAAYKCPKCKKSPFLMLPGGPGAPMPPPGR
jgi:hypothetical protein